MSWDEWTTVLKEGINKLIESDLLLVEIIKPERIPPVCILKITRYGEDEVYHAISATAVGKFVNEGRIPLVEDAIAALDKYHRTRYLEIYPHGDVNNNFEIIHDFTTPVSNAGLTLIKVSNQSNFGGRRRGDTEQRVEYFIYLEEVGKAIRVVW